MDELINRLGYIALNVAPIEKSTPPEAEALAARLYAMLPRVRITDLLAEVAGWTMFPDCFTHLRADETAPTPARCWPGCWPTASTWA